mgnify:CR=1 FL=1
METALAKVQQKNREPAIILAEEARYSTPPEVAPQGNFIISWAATSFKSFL